MALQLEVAAQHIRGRSRQRQQKERVEIGESLTFDLKCYIDAAYVGRIGNGAFDMQLCGSRDEIAPERKHHTRLLEAQYLSGNGFTRKRCVVVFALKGVAG